MAMRTAAVLARHQMNSLAEHVAEGGTILAWCQINALTRPRGYWLWGQIKAGLGDQAR